MKPQQSYFVAYYLVTLFFSPSAEVPKKHRVRFSNIMEVRQLPSNQALEAKLSRMSYAACKDQESLLRTAGKLTVAEVAKISFFVCFVVSWQSRCLYASEVEVNVYFKHPTR